MTLPTAHNERAYACIPGYQSPREPRGSQSWLWERCPEISQCSYSPILEMGQLSEDVFSPPKIACLGHCLPGGPGSSGNATEAFGASTLPSPPPHTLTFLSYCSHASPGRGYPETAGTACHTAWHTRRLELSSCFSSCSHPLVTSKGSGPERQQGLEPTSKLWDLEEVKPPFAHLPNGANVHLRDRHEDCIINTGG